MKYLIPLIIFFSCTPIGQHVPPAVDKPEAVVVEPVQLGKNGCTDRKWKDRGYMPAGAAKGIIESYKREMAKGNKGRAIHDKMGVYRSKSYPLDALKHYGIAGGNELRKTYAFLMGLCMRESNCNYSLGRDYTAAGPQNSRQAESGMWQFSFDAIGSDPELKEIYEKYQKPGADCMAATYGEGVTKRTTGYITSPADGYAFQKFFRSCPAAQAEYAAVMIRVKSIHFGPIIRKEVEYVKACEDLLAANE
jgi:hypothetical protein